MPTDEMCNVVEEFGPEVVSFHFGLPESRLLDRGKGVSILPGLVRRFLPRAPSGQVPERVDRLSVTANLEVQHDTPLARASHVRKVLAALDLHLPRPRAVFRCGRKRSEAGCCASL